MNFAICETDCGIPGGLRLKPTGWRKAQGRTDRRCQRQTGRSGQAFSHGNIQNGKFHQTGGAFQSASGRKKTHFVWAVLRPDAGMLCGFEEFLRFGYQPWENACPLLPVRLWQRLPARPCAFRHPVRAGLPGMPHFDRTDGNFDTISVPYEKEERKELFDRAGVSWYTKIIVLCVRRAEHEKSCR